MNTIKKIDITRIFLAFIVVILLIFPIDTAGIETTKLFINESIVVDIKYLITGGIFLLAVATNFLGIYIKKSKRITNCNQKFTDVSNKILINSVLVVLTSQGFIQPIIPVIIIIRDCIVDGLFPNQKTTLTEIFKLICVMIGITLTLFYNLPFELWNLRIAEFLLVVAIVLSIISAFEYYYQNKKVIK